MIKKISSDTVVIDERAVCDDQEGKHCGTIFIISKDRAKRHRPTVTCCSHAK